MPTRIKFLLFVSLSLAFIGCDRVTKNMAKEHLKDKAAVSILHDTFRMEYAENTGAALNLGDDLSKTASFWLLSMLPLAFLFLVFYYAIKNTAKFGRMKLLSLSLIFSGGIGNIIDRLLYDRHVTDFMIINLHGWHTGIFNVADVCVTAGVIGLLIFQNQKNKTSEIS